ncbi:hypothetical protein BKA70DRAFT_1563363 [Coprinopsis sp. MPI-PUGE-AT-0042]|nr:hypothetical protein BKA70DRAFT_1563363 [Coprinopsis sp. MPI-PUGE-AT-0042]
MASLMLDSTLIQYSRSNEELPEHLISECQSKLAEMKSTLASTTREIERIKENLVGLETKKKKIKEAMAIYENLLFPLRRFPEKLIGQVIRNCFGEPGNLLDRSDRRLFCALRCISKKWRAVAYSLPELWQGVYVDGSESSPSSSIIQKLRGWFAHSRRQRPVKLTLRGIPDIPVKEIQAFILDPQWHWARLSLNLEPSTICALVEGIRDSKNCWDSIEHLELDAMGAHFVFSATLVALLMDTGNPRFSALQHLQLRRMELDNALRGQPYHATLSTIHLTDCILSDAMTSALFSPICLPCLQDVILINASPALLVYRGPPMAHPGVRRAVIAGTSCALVLALILPNLEKLQLSHIGSPDAELIPFLHGSCANLHCVSIRGYEPQALAKVLCHIPSIKSFYTDSLDVFRYLSYSKGGSLSALQTLVCPHERMTIQRSTSDAFFSFLDQRKIEESDLTVKVISYKYPETADILRHVEEYGRTKLQSASTADISWIF